MKLSPSPFLDSNAVLLDWRDQTAAHFARRAFSQLGRGFVIPDETGSRFIYVNRVDDAPFELLAEIYKYSPDTEAVVVHEDATQPGSLIVRRIRLETRQ